MERQLTKGQSALAAAIGIFLGILFVFLLLVYLFTGFFIVQPIGAIPDGVTFWYLRYGTNFDFFESADSISMKATGGVSLLTRGLTLGKVIETIDGKILARFPYFEWMYQSTIEKTKR